MASTGRSPHQQADGVALSAACNGVLYLTASGGAGAAALEATPAACTCAFKWRAVAIPRKSLASHVFLKQYVYNLAMIRSFASTETERFYVTGKSRRIPPEIRTRAALRLTQLNAVTRTEDLRLPPSNQLEALSGERNGQWSIRVNQQWRVCFRFENGDAFDVEIVDYH